MRTAKRTTLQGGRRPRRKGNLAERALVKFFQAKGFASERIPLSGSAGGRYSGDLTVPVIGRGLVVEVKVRKTGFSQLYRWLSNRDLLILKADRRPPIVALPLALAAEIAGVAELNKGRRS